MDKWEMLKLMCTLAVLTLVLNVTALVMRIDQMNNISWGVIKIHAITSIIVTGTIGLSAFIFIVRRLNRTFKQQ